MQTTSMRRTHTASAPTNHGLSADLASRFDQDAQRDGAYGHLDLEYIKKDRPLHVPPV